MTEQDRVWRNYIRRDIHIAREMKTDPLRREIQSEVEAFLKAGGRITKIPSGVSGQDFTDTRTQSQQRKKIAQDGFHRMQMRLPNSREARA